MAIRTASGKLATLTLPAFRVDADLYMRIVRMAGERGEPVGRVVRDLVTLGLAAGDGKQQEKTR